MLHSFEVGDEVECTNIDYKKYLDGKIGQVIGRYRLGDGSFLDVKFPGTNQGYNKDIWVIHFASLIPAKPPKPIGDYL